MKFEIGQSLTYGERHYSVYEKTETFDVQYYSAQSDCRKFDLRLRHDTKDSRWYMHRSWPRSTWDEIKIDDDRSITAV